MNWFTGILVYLIIWWLVLFMVLPLWVRKPKEVEPGHDHGAPENPMIAKKALVTTLVSAVVFAIVFAVIEADVISFRDAVRN